MARLVAVAALAQRAHVAGRGGRVGEAQLERVQRRPGRGLAARAPERALELRQRRRGAAAPAARREEAERDERPARRATIAGIRHHGARLGGAGDAGAALGDAGRRRSSSSRCRCRAVDELAASAGWLRAGESAGVGSNVSQPQFG